MSGDMALNEKENLFGVESACKIDCKRFHCSSAELCGILTDGYRVHIDNAINAVILIFKGAPVFYRAEVISDCEVTRGLYARKNDFFVICKFHI